MTKILPLLSARYMYSFLCTRRLQPPRIDCAVRVQWFSSVITKEKERKKKRTEKDSDHSANQVTFETRNTLSKR